MEALLQLIHVDPALVLKALPIVALCMGILSGVSVGLNAVAKFTKTDADDKAVSVIGKVMEVLQKGVDFFSGNIKH